MVAVRARREGLSEAQARARDACARAHPFGKSYPCLRASPVPKKYGRGVHRDGRGRIALFGVETADDRRFAAGTVPGATVVCAMRSGRTT